MKKILITCGIIIALVIIIYAIVWVQSYNLSKKYYNMAVENYNNDNYAIALKGDRVLKEDEGGYIYLGGFQQVIEMWQSPTALPKPSVALDAEVMVWRIISEIDIETGKSIFKSYFGIDNTFLPEVLIRIGELQMEEGQYDKARETFTMAGEAFSRYDGITEIVERNLHKIKDME